MNSILELQLINQPMPPPPPAAPPRFHVIIVLHNSAQWIESCMAAVTAQSLPASEVTVFDNTSADDGPARVAAGWPEVRLMRSPRNLGFAGGANRAAAAVRDADYILTLNPDAVLAQNALERLAAVFAAQPGVGVLGCKVLERDIDTIQDIGMRLRGNGLPRRMGQNEPDRGQYSGVRTVKGVLGAAAAVRARVWNELGGLDERFWPVYYETMDLCWRAWKAGWRVAVACDAVATHFTSVASHRRDPRLVEHFFRNRARFLLKHYGPLDWLVHYLPDELRWFCLWEAKGMRRTALRTLFDVALGRKKDEG